MSKKLTWRGFIPLVLFLVVSILGIKALIAPYDNILFSKIGCRDILGEEMLLSSDGPEIIVFGEIHGAEESPKIVGELVCKALENEIPVILAIEYPDNKQHDIDVFMNNREDYPRAKEKLLSSSFWATEVQDGRKSLAMYDMVQRVKFLYGFGLDVRVIAFQPSANFSVEYPDLTDNELRALYEERMASNLLNIQKKRGTKVIALVGNYHAKRGRYEQGDVSYRLMADYLPTDTAITLNVNSQAGTFWNCQNGECKIHNAGVGLSGVFLKKGNPMLSPAIHLYNENKDGYDGLFYTVTSTASLPAINQEVTQ